MTRGAAHLASLQLDAPLPGFGLLQAGKSQNCFNELRRRGSAIARLFWQFCRHLHQTRRRSPLMLMSSWL